MSRRNIIANSDAIDDDFIDEFVRTPEGLPILLMNILEEFDEDAALKRFDVYMLHPELEEMDNHEIAVTSRLLKEGKSDEAEEFQISYALDFLGRHPQFKAMVEGVESAGHNDLRIALSLVKEAFLGDIDYF